VVVLVGAFLLVSAAPAARGPAAVVRAWSAALNRGDNQTAANLFAKNAVVAQPGYTLPLKTHKLAVLWNKSLPCAGHILWIIVRKNVADATFLLSDRSPAQPCDAPGTRAHAAFTVANGKITAFVQLPVVPRPKPKKKPGALTA
jgi:hypothetical protein